MSVFFNNLMNREAAVSISNVSVHAIMSLQQNKNIVERTGNIFNVVASGVFSDSSDGAPVLSGGWLLPEAAVSHK